MNLSTIIDNLRRTIAGKEMMLDTYNNPGVLPYPPEVMAAMKMYLTNNIEELKKILVDLESIK